MNLVELQHGIVDLLCPFCNQKTLYAAEILVGRHRTFQLSCESTTCECCWKLCDTAQRVFDKINRAPINNK